MATRNSSGVARRRVRLDGNRPRTHPKCHSSKATKPRPAALGGNGCRDVPLHLRPLRRDHGAVDHALHGVTA
jgi:hypothetical protein